MALPSFDSEVHHVGLGLDPENLKGLYLFGTRTKQLSAPPFEKATTIGDEALVSNERFSTWTQNDYSGGEFFYDFTDEAGFRECDHFSPNLMGKSLVSVRPIVPAKVGFDVDWLRPIPLLMTQIEGKLFVVWIKDDTRWEGKWDSTTVVANNLVKLSRFSGLGTAGPVAFQSDTIDLPQNKTALCAALTKGEGQLWLGTTVPDVRRYQINPDANDPSDMFTFKDLLNPPTISPDPVARVVGIFLMEPLRLVAFRRNNVGFDVLRSYITGTGANAEWADVGRLPGRWIQGIQYNGACYIMTRSSGGTQTQISMTQGEIITPIVSFPYQFKGERMVEYAGRLYVAGTGVDLDGLPASGEIHEISGTSTRLVRTFKPEYERADGHRVLGRMRCAGVDEGLLWVPNNEQSGVELYDAVTDAFYGGPQLLGGPDPLIEFVDMLPMGHTMYLWAQATETTGAAKEKQGLYRVSPRSKASGGYSPSMTTSSFAISPGRQKIWGEVVSLSRYRAPGLEVSTDGAATWVSVEASSSSEEFGRVFETVFELSAIPNSRTIHLRFTFDQAGTANENIVELISHSLSFLVKGDSRKQWSFSVPAVLNPEGMDEEMHDQEPTDVTDQLWDWFEAGQQLVYKDTNGRNYTVIISNLRENQLQVTADNEAHLLVTLLEVGDPPEEDAPPP